MGHAGMPPHDRKGSREGVRELSENHGNGRVLCEHKYFLRGALSVFNLAKPQLNRNKKEALSTLKFN